MLLLRVLGPLCSPKPHPLMPGPGSPGDHVGAEAHEKGPYEGADLLGGPLPPPLLLLQTAFPHTVWKREKVTQGSLPAEVLLTDTAGDLQSQHRATEPRRPGVESWLWLCERGQAV